MNEEERIVGGLTLLVLIEALKELVDGRDLVATYNDKDDDEQGRCD